MDKAADSSQTGSDEVAVDLRAITQIAERRRQDLKQDLAKPVPEFIIAVDQAEVRYTIEPVMLPFSQMDFDVFCKRLKEKYNVTFKKPTLPKSLLKLTQDDEIGTAQAQDLISSDLPTEELEFVEGRLPVGTDDFVPIRSITFNSESVHVVVRGNSKVADLIVKEVVEELWASTGMPKRWDSIKPMVQMISYGTATKVNFGFPIERMLSSDVATFLNKEFIEGKRFASCMVARSARDSFKPPSDTFSMWTIQDLHLFLHVFNKVNGRPERSQFRLLVRSKDETGTGIVAAVSELPFDEHVECLSMLRDHLLAKA